MSGATLDPAGPARDSRTRLSRSVDGLSSTIPLPLWIPCAVRTPWDESHGLGSSAFARRYLRNHCYFLFLRLLRCFSSPGSPRMAMDSPCGGMQRMPGFPIQTSADQCSCAAPRGFSQLIASFIGSQCQGIRPVPYYALPLCIPPERGCPDGSLHALTGDSVRHARSSLVLLAVAFSI